MLSAIAGNPRDPVLNEWLCSLAPRAELSLRFAMRARFHELRGERAFAARVQHLVDRLHLSGDELTDVIADSRRLGECIDGFLREVALQIGDAGPATLSAAAASPREGKKSSRARERRR